MSSEYKNFKLHIIDGYISNIYLLEYDNGLLLFDSGAVNDVKRIENFCLNTLKRQPSDILLTVVSHMHPDHSGGAAKLRKKYGIPIASYKDCDKWYSGIGGFIQHKSDLFMMMIVARSRKRNFEKILYRPRIRPDYKLNDWDSLPIFGDWQVIHVPGHTLHDIVLYNRQEKLLYAADCLIYLDGVLRLPLPVMFPKIMDQSFEKMSSLNPETILLAHGDTITAEDIPDLFASARELLTEPANRMTLWVYTLSVYSPEIWRYYLHNSWRRRLKASS